MAQLLNYPGTNIQVVQLTISGAIYYVVDKAGFQQNRYPQAQSVQGAAFMGVQNQVAAELLGFTNKLKEWGVQGLDVGNPDAHKNIIKQAFDNQIVLVQ